MKIHNLKTTLHFINFKRITKPAVLSISLLLIISTLTALSTTTVKGTSTNSTSPNLVNNAVWIEDNSYWLGQAPLSASSIDSTVATLAENNIKYVFLNVGVDDYWNQNGALEITLVESNSTYQTFIDLCHAQGIEVLAWMENEQSLNFTPLNWNTLYTVYNSVLAIGFDGINSDIEQSYNTATGTQQNYIDFNNNATVYFNAEGKLWMPDVAYYDSGTNAAYSQINQYLHVNAIVLMFYGSESLFESSSASAFWNEEFTPAPASPLILGIFCDVSSGTYIDSWQFQQCANLINNYPPTTNLEGVSLWLYECVVDHNSWGAFDNLINQFIPAQTQSATPTPFAPIVTAIATINQVQTASNQALSGSSLELTWKSQPTSGDMLALTVCVYDGFDSVSGISEPGVTWTKTTSITNGPVDSEIWSALTVGSSAATTLTIDYIGSVPSSATACEYSAGSPTTWKVDQTETNVGFNTIGSTGQITTTQPDVVIVGSLAFDSSGQTNTGLFTMLGGSEYHWTLSEAYLQYFTTSTGTYQAQTSLAPYFFSGCIASYVPASIT
jgi:hypothetical protein